MAEPFVRSDIWSLESDGGPWHPVTMAYALGVRAMQGRPAADPTSWEFQAAIHSSLGGDWRQQCQHRCWYFLPWHRAYLYWFEQILREAIRSLAEVDDAIKETWALPYWDYSRGGDTATLPPVFRQPSLPDNGGPNPLFVADRKQYVNDGEPLPDEAVGITTALGEGSFAAPQFTGGFGGAVTGPNHYSEDAAANSGALEETPHGDVHVEVGGLMASFETAGLDPVFWMHHANIDRLWIVWHGVDPARADPNVQSWRDQVFPFFRPDRSPATSSAAQVLDTITQLEYTYEDVAPPAAPLAVPEEEPAAVNPPDHPPELIGATAAPVQLTGGAAQVAFAVAEAQGPAAMAVQEGGERVYLNVDGITGTRNPGVVYGVYLNLPDDDDPDREAERHRVGNASFFGIEKSADPDADEPALRYAWDVTALVNELRASGTWDPARVTVTFAPLRPLEEADAGVGALAVEEPITIGSVGLFVQ